MADSVGIGSGALKVGSGLIEIAALTALVGSSTAQSLMLGNRGAVGLVWAAMSMFGVLSMIKACLAASIPAWLRDTLGVRGVEADDALGLSLMLEKEEFKARNSIARDTVGLVSEIQKEVNAKSASDDGPLQTASYDIYALDQQTSHTLSLLSAIKDQSSFTAYILPRDPFSKSRLITVTRYDWWCLLASLVKLVELFVLWKLNATALGLITCGIWIHFFFGSMMLQALKISREYDQNMSDSELDVLAGQLPTPVKSEGEPKVVLGVTKNVRLHICWKLVWGFGSIVSAMALIATYITLGKHDIKIICVWIGFQVSWLALRSVFFHFAEGMDKAFHRPFIVRKEWQSLPWRYKVRVRHLLSALSQYQMHVHPRRLYCYQEDMQTLETILNIRSEFPLDPSIAVGDTTDLSVSAVVGDTLLSSAAWMLGSKLSGMDLYDSCVVVLTVNGKSVAIPSARVLSEPPIERPSDLELGSELQFVPRGSSNTGRNPVWWYWIPCGHNRWLQAHTEQKKILGKRKATVVSDEQITQRLAIGDLYVGIKNVDDVKDIVRHSKLGCELLLRFLD
ncbi:MAG: hypothetical protein M1816_004228 [Peltula sp. TS41687]|nr:MAG: hypothetical protein M1816_004228 [Peltula sp. TS41687]